MTKDAPFEILERYDPEPFAVPTRSAKTDKLLLAEEAHPAGGKGPRRAPLNSYQLAGTGTTGNNTHVLPSGYVVNAERVAVQLLVEAVGATPTMNWQVQGSMDGTNWYDVRYITDASDTPASGATAVIAVGPYIKYFYTGPGARYFRYFRLVTSANTNVTYSARIDWQERPI